MLGKKLAISLGFYQAGAEIIIYISVILIIFYGTTLYFDGLLSKGAFLSYLLYAIYVSHAIGAVSSHAGGLNKK